MFTAVLVIVLVYTLLVVWFVHAVRRAPYLDGGPSGSRPRRGTPSHREGRPSGPPSAGRSPNPFVAPPAARETASRESEAKDG